jgi:hypothetical protein
MLPITDLLQQLENAVRSGDRQRAHDIAAQIRQQIVLQTDKNGEVERRVNELLAQIDRPTLDSGVVDVEFSSISDVGHEELPGLRRTRRLHYPELFDPESGGRVTRRGAREPAARREPTKNVYRVWFGTNREPNASGFADVFVPDAHRFGETGSPFWKKLLRFDLRDDRLRVQQVQPLERELFFSKIRRAIQEARDSGETPQALFFCTGST